MDHGIAASRLRWREERRQRGAQDDTANALHKACGGWQLLKSEHLTAAERKGFGAPTGEGRIEDFQRIGPENRLKVLAAEKDVLRNP